MPHLWYISKFWARIHDGVEWFGHVDTSSNYNVNAIGIPSTNGQSKHAIVELSLCSNLFTQDTFISLNHAPLVIALEMVGNATNWLGTVNNNDPSPVVNSTAWVIEQPQIKFDIVTLDSELHNAYAAQLFQKVRACPNVLPITQLTLNKHNVNTILHRLIVHSRASSRCVLVCGMVMETIQTTKPQLLYITQ